MAKIIKEIDFHGRKLTLETGRLATQADASVVASWGDTVVLATVTTKPNEEPVDYFPLSVEYVEKYYAAGRITAQKFIKRETRPPEAAILAGRAIDRSIRPLFPKEFSNAVQVIVTVLSYDGINNPATLGYIATSAALSISSVPWHGSLGVGEIAIKEGQTIFYPTILESDNAEMSLITASTKDRVVMIETEAKEVSDKVVFESIKSAHQESQILIDLINDLSKEVLRPSSLRGDSVEPGQASKEKLPVVPVAETIPAATLNEAKKEIKDKIKEALEDKDHPWHEATGDLIKQDLSLRYAEKLTSQQISAIFDKVAKEMMHDLVLNQGKRVDGRAVEEVRPIDIEVGVLPRTHGSAVFQRGLTQVLGIATLGPLSDSQILEGMTGESKKRFMHHYNMSINPFSVGEVKRLGAPNRRDIGHGALAEKALVNVLPLESEFPYAFRVVSEVLAANASTSMAATCAMTLALLNAGVPLKNPVAGIALGLMYSDAKQQVITDMQAVEDFYGDMDFKVTGTKNGVTAIQMDTKLEGITFEIIEEALSQGKKAREFILEKMNQVLPAAGELSKYAPKIETMKINPEEIGTLIGTGGKTINGLIAKTGAQIDVEDDGTVMVSSVDEAAVKETIAQIKAMFTPIEMGQIFEGKVVKIAPFGAFVELTPGKDGLVHVSQMAPHRVERPEDIVSLGQVIKVKVVEVTPEGKVGLSMNFGENASGDQDRRPSERFDRGDRHRFGGRRR